jgi:hypothetical protein
MDMKESGEGARIVVVSITNCIRAGGSGCAGALG